MSSRDEGAVEAVAHQRGEAHDVDVGGHREHAARFLDAAEVRDADQRDQRQAEQHPVFGEIVELGDRDDGGDAGGDRHRDGEDVVDEQRRAGDERRVLAEVLAAHHVAAAAARVGEDRLAVRRDHDRQQDRHRDPDRDQRVEAEGEARGADRDDEEDLLGGVGGGRDGVGGEDRERDRLRDPLMLRSRSWPEDGQPGSA